MLAVIMIYTCMLSVSANTLDDAQSIVNNSSSIYSWHESEYDNLYLDGGGYCTTNVACWTAYRQNATIEDTMDIVVMWNWILLPDNDQYQEGAVYTWDASNKTYVKAPPKESYDLPFTFYFIMVNKSNFDVEYRVIMTPVDTTLATDGYEVNFDTNDTDVQADGRIVKSGSIATIAPTLNLYDNYLTSEELVATPVSGDETVDGYYAMGLTTSFVVKTTEFPDFASATTPPYAFNVPLFALDIYFERAD